MIDAGDSLSHRTMLTVLYSTGMRNAELRQPQVGPERNVGDQPVVVHGFGANSSSATSRSPRFQIASTARRTTASFIETRRASQHDKRCTIAPHGRATAS